MHCAELNKERKWTGPWWSSGLEKKEMEAGPWRGTHQKSSLIVVILIKWQKMWPEGLQTKKNTGPDENTCVKACWPQQKCNTTLKTEEANNALNNALSSNNCDKGLPVNCNFNYVRKDYKGLIHTLPFMAWAFWFSHFHIFASFLF